MQKKIFRIATTLILTCLFGVGVTSQAMARDFSADVVQTFGNKTTQSKMYVSGDKIRSEMAEMTMIIRKDMNVMWMLMPEQKTYMEQPLDLSKLPQTSQEVAGEMERKSLGMEDVSGQQAEKFEVTYTAKGKTTKMYQWMGPQGIPIKTAAVDGSWSTEYKNISLSTPPAELFEAPADYQKMQMPSLGGMMKGILGQ